MGDTADAPRGATTVEPPRELIRESGSFSVADSLGEKLPWLMMFRLVLVTFLLGSAVIVNVNDAESASDPSYAAILALIVATYAATVGYAAWLRKGRALGSLALTQIVGDTLLTGGLVFLTGGVESIFSFLFFLSVFNGAILTGRRGALFAASGSSLALVAIAVLQFAQVDLLREYFPDAMPRVGKVPIYAIIVHLVSFYTVAALAGYLSEKLGQIGTELEQSQIDLRDLRTLHETVVRSIDLGLIALDHHHRILYANDAAEVVTEIPLQRHFGRFVGTVAPELWLLLVAADREPAGAHVEGDYRVPTRDGGDRRLNLSQSALRHVDGSTLGRLVVLRDVSELRLLQQEVRRSEHLASLGNLAASMAHEIRNPLAAISGSVEILRMEQGDSETSAPLMDIVIREVDRLNGLIRDFLEYARPRRIERRATCVRELVDHTVSAFENDVEVAAGVSIRVLHGVADTLMLGVDADRIQQVLWNLLRNAAEAAGPGGWIEVQTDIESWSGAAARAVTIAVQDSGPGLAEAATMKLFEPFFTTKPNGTGLGLATSYRIVTEHGGVLRVSNTRGAGARFVVALPVGGAVLSERATDRAVPTARAPRVHSGGYTTV